VLIQYSKNKNNIIFLKIAPQIIFDKNNDFFESFSNCIDKIEKEGVISGIVLNLNNNKSVNSYEVKKNFEEKDPTNCFKKVEIEKSILRRFETLDFPKVAILDGSVFNLIFELALCCNYRIALNAINQKFGFTNTNLGIMPGKGGLVRLTRVIGIEQTLDFLLFEKLSNVKSLVEKGVLQNSADSLEELTSLAEIFINKNQKCKQPWDIKGYKIPGGASYQNDNPIIIADYSTRIFKKNLRNCPVYEAIISTVTEGASLSFDSASKIESRYYVELVTGDVSKNLVSAHFIQKGKINSGYFRPKNQIKNEFTKIAVLGSGLMGHGIAYVSAMADIEVVLIDTSKDNLDKGLKRIKNILSFNVDKGLIETELADDIFSKVNPSLDYSQIKDCDLIIEAVFEDRDIKAKAIKESEKYMKKSAIFASNTSTISINELNHFSSNPENFIGIHFFSPVDRMELVEIIKTKKTSAETLSYVFDFIRKINKTPIIVNDSPGFYTTRVFEKYTCEGLALLYEGYPAHLVETTSKNVGFPIGPLAVLDEINIELALKIRKEIGSNLYNQKPEHHLEPWDEVLNFMVNKAKRRGRSSGSGFYEYPKSERKYLWPDLHNHFVIQFNKPDQQLLIDRLLFVQALETVRCYEEGVIQSFDEANIGSIYGWGFPAFRGGTLQFINDYGLVKFKKRALVLASKYGERYKPPKIIDRMIESDEIFSQ
tara:strand:- start:2046 stop:4175 length:2130 start_codon:yes stop_codon:yes gene_type:complete